MSEEKKRPKTKNLSSDKKRFIKIKIDVRKVNKEWMFQGEKGTYLAMTLMMLPNGEIDKYGNLGMVIQDVPEEVYQKQKNLPKEQHTKGEILGNAAELDWDSNGSSAEGSVLSNSGSMGVEDDDDLPF